MIQSVRHFLEYAGLWIVVGLFRLMPFQLSLRLAWGFAPFLSTLYPVRKKIILENLRTAFPDADPPRLKFILKETYRNFLLFIVEFIKFDQRTAYDLARQVTETEGEEYFKEVGGGERPFLALTAHIGNWELMGAYFAGRGVPLSVLAKPIHNPYVDRIVNKIRGRKGLEVISIKDSPIKEVLQALKEGRCVAMLADQDARRAGIFVNFFGRPASTFTGPALFSVRTGLPLLPVFDIRTGISQHKVVFLPPLYPSLGEESREAAIKQLTEQYVHILEEIIQQYPGQCFWFHRRWKTRPSLRTEKDENSRNES